MSARVVAANVDAQSPGAPTTDTRTAIVVTNAVAQQQLQNMRDFLAFTRTIVDGLAVEDFATIEAAAKKMGYSQEREKSARVVAGAVTSFAELAVGYLRSVDTIASAAHAKDSKAVLRALSVSLAQCNACHAAYQLRVQEQK